MVADPTGPSHRAAPNEPQTCAGTRHARLTVPGHRAAMTLNVAEPSGTSTLSPQCTVGLHLTACLDNTVAR